jgi:hypothetical protein
MKDATKLASWLIQLLTVASIASCQQRPGVTIRTNGILTLIDSTSKPDAAEYTLNDGITGIYPIYYIGKIADTIHLGKRSIPRYNEALNNTFDMQAIMSHKPVVPDSTNVKIFVDTILTLTHPFRYYDKNGEEVQDSSRYYPSFALLIYNHSELPLSVASFSELLRTVRQVKDSSGHWVDAETPLIYGCATGSQEKFIPPGQMLIAKTFRKPGNVKAECRLKFDYYGLHLYSNTFADYVANVQVSEVLQIKKTQAHYDSLYAALRTELAE